MLEGLDRIPWASLGHAYGEASDVPDQIRGLASDDAEVRERSLWNLYGNIYHQGTVYEATSRVVPFLIELAARPGAPDRSKVLGLVASIAEGSSYHDVHQHLSIFHEEARTAEFQERVAEELADVRAVREAVLAGVPTVARLLADPDLEVRITSSYLLGRLPEAARETIGALKERVELERDAKAKASAILAVGALLGTTALGMDRDRLAEIAHEDGPPVVTLAAAMSLARMTPGEVPEDVVELLSSAVGPGREDYSHLPWSESDAVDEVGALLENRPGARLNFQVSLLSHDDPKVRKAAITSIEGLCEARRSAPKVAATPLAGRLGDGDQSIREAAATTLNRIGRSARAVIPDLFDALSDPSPTVRIHAAVALGKAGDDRAVPALIEGLGSAREFEYVTKALAALGPKAAPAVPSLIGIVDAGPSDQLTAPWNRSIQAAIALGKIGEPAIVAIPSLIEAVRRGQGLHSACSAFVDFGPSARAALPELESFLDVGDVNLRAKVAHAYWRAGGDAGRAVACLAAAIREQPGSCWNAIGVLAEIGEPARSALPLLEGPMNDRAAYAEWFRVQAARAYWRIDRRADVALPTLLDLLGRIESLGAMRANLIVEALGELGPLAHEAIPRIRAVADRDDRPFGSGLNPIIEEDEAFLANVDTALARIEGPG